MQKLTPTRRSATRLIDTINCGISHWVDMGKYRLVGLLDVVEYICFAAYRSNSESSYAAVVFPVTKCSYLQRPVIRPDNLLSHDVFRVTRYGRK